ncbi:MAG: SDR family oxidoreductase [Traorella sp.]
MKEFDLFSLKNKVIVITGSTGGLGTHFVDKLAWAGADLAIMDIPASKERLQELAKKIHDEYGTNVKTYTIDIGNEEDVKEKCAQVLRDFGHIDGVLNNAGINQHGTVEEYTQEDIDRLLHINASGTFAMCKHFGKVLCDQRKGSIVNIASVSGTIVNRAPRPMSGYCISKAAVKQLTRALAAEYGQCNVRVNSISPGFMETRMNNVKGFIAVDPSINQQYLVQGSPMQRFCKADELTGAAIYLLSDASTFTNGIDLVVDGGFLVW